VLPFKKISPILNIKNKQLFFNTFFEKQRLCLHYLWFWRIIGFILISVVVWLSLTPKLPQVGSLFSYDKLGHFLAYAILMSWFAQLHLPSKHLRLALYLIFLGIFLEYLQSLSAVRTPDLIDAIANSLGVLMGWVLMQTPLQRTLFFIDTILYKLNTLIYKIISIN